MLEVTDLTRTYGHGAAAHVAIEGVSRSVAEGELVSIVGPSGCGKSTLLRCVAGLLTPTAGQIELNGSLVERVPDRLSVVFQDYSRSLYPWLTVQDNVALPLRRTERSRKARRAAPTGRSPRSGCRTWARSIPGSCPAACSSGSRSPGRWPATRSCC